MAKIPNRFMGQKFMAKFGVIDPFSFRVEDGELICPDLPDLTDEDLLDCAQTQEELDNIATSQIAKAGAKSRAKHVIELRTATQKDVENYIDNNVTDIASAKSVLKILARIIVAMRDEIWSDLGED